MLPCFVCAEILEWKYGRSREAWRRLLCSYGEYGDPLKINLICFHSFSSNYEIDAVSFALEITVAWCKATLTLRCCTFSRNGNLQELYANSTTNVTTFAQSIALLEKGLICATPQISEHCSRTHSRRAMAVNIQLEMHVSFGSALDT
jgi:hypothetical protein